MKFKHPHIYAIMAMVEKEDYSNLTKYKNKLNPHVQFYMKEEHFDNIAPQHISMCYFSYSDKYPEEEIQKLIHKIAKIASKYLPLKVRVKGLKGGWELGLESPILAGHPSPVIMWNILDFEEIIKFHTELIQELKKDIEHFNDPDLEFTPHIGVALGKDESIEELKKIVNKTKNDNEIELNLSSLQIYFPNGPKEVYRKNN